MAGNVTVDNNLGAAFLGITISCEWVIHSGFSKHPDTFITVLQSVSSELLWFKHIHITLIIPKTGCSKRSRWVLLQASIRKISWRRDNLLKVGVLMYAPSLTMITRREVLVWASHPFRTLAVLHTIFTIHSVYFYLINNFGNPEGLETVVWYVYSVSDVLYVVFISTCE